MKNLKNWVFKQVHTNNLVYNACWEDPRCDRELMELDSNSEIVMITSAGCNALDYLLDQPSSINCIDMNPRQNALLELKIAAFQNAAFEDLFQLFGKGAHSDIKAIYREQLRYSLPNYAQNYWDKNLNYFNGQGLRKSFYFYSTSGTVAWLTNQYLRLQKRVYRMLHQLFEAASLEEQRNIYYSVEPRLMNRLAEWVVNRHFTMCMVGVPQSQQLLFKDKYERGALGFIQECLRKVFTERPIQENYFWKVYLKGQYTNDCCPSYLKRENFDALKVETQKIKTHNTTISQFLKDNPKDYSHYVLLDHQDWLAMNNLDALEEEWHLILANSRKGTKILLRSAADEIDFFPGFVLDSVEFEKEKTLKTHQEDRVGTYASVYLGIVK